MVDHGANELEDRRLLPMPVGEETPEVVPLRLKEVGQALLDALLDGGHQVAKNLGRDEQVELALSGSGALELRRGQYSLNRMRGKKENQYRTRKASLAHLSITSRSLSTSSFFVG